MAQDTIATILETDLANSRMNQADLATRLSELGPTTITESAITNWKARNSIPMKRLKQLADIFGPSSKCAQLFAYKYPNALLAAAIDRNISVDSFSVGPGSVEAAADLQRAAHHGTASVRPANTFYVRERAVAALRSQLPFELRDFVLQPFQMAGDKRVFDFLNEAIAIEVIAARSPKLQIELLARKVVKLGALREVTRELFPERRYAVILVRLPRRQFESSEAHSWNAQIQTLIGDCHMMGIWVESIDNIEDIPPTLEGLDMRARKKATQELHHLEDEEP